MAESIVASISARLDGDTLTDFTIATGTLTIAMTGADFFHGSQNIGTSAENLAKGDIGTPGYILVHNLDATNYVEIGHDETGTFVADVKLKKGEWAFFRCAQATPQARANTGACNIEYVLFED